MGEGSLVLFSSWAKLNAFKDAIPSEFKEYCLIQGDLSRSEISRKHKAAVDNGKTSIVCGLQSLGEGIDFKGKHLTTIIIPQIPFMHVSDPVSSAESDHFTSQGLNPFMKIQLPLASIKLVQWCGRLIRTESDTGDIYIFDNRISTKGYGKGMLATLPQYTRVG